MNEGDLVLTPLPKAPAHAGLEGTGLHEPELLRRMVDIIVREANPEE
jgi:hypothetical protein